MYGDVCTRTTGAIPANNNAEVLYQDGEESWGSEHNTLDTDSSLCDSTEYEHTTQTDCDYTAFPKR